GNDQRTSGGQVSAMLVAPPEKPGNTPDQPPYQGGVGGGHPPKNPRRAPAVNQSREHVAASLIGAERMARITDLLEPSDYVCLVRVLRRHPWCEDRHQKDT